MRNAIIVLASVIAGIIFCSVFACTTQKEICQIFCLERNLSYTNYLSTIANLGIFIATLSATIYAAIEYDNHKREQRINLLGEYNQRYSSDNNIYKVITWMLRVAILNDKGEIVGADPIRFYYNPGIHEKEMFMRFFEELYLHIDNKSLDKEQVCLLFSYYAIKFDEIKEFRLDITDYYSKVELEKRGKTDDKKDNYNKYWTNYRKFVDEMRKEWKKIEEMNK